MPTQQDANSKNNNVFQARSINKYLNVKHKLLNCNANIHFNTTCIVFKLVTKYAKTKINSHCKETTQHLIDKIQEIRIRNEIKLGHTKKQMLNKQLNNLHLENSKNWGKVWDIIDQNIAYLCMPTQQDANSKNNNKVHHLQPSPVANRVSLKLGG
jgi:hypothetical protein